MTEQYTNIYQWGETHLGQTLDNRHRKVWEHAGKLLVTVPKGNLEVWECDNTLITIRTYATGCFKLLDVQ